MLLAARDFQFWRGPSARLPGPHADSCYPWPGGSRSGVLRARRPGRAQSHQWCDALSPARTPGWLMSAKQPRKLSLRLPWRPALCPAG